MIRRISRLHYDNGEIGRLIHQARIHGFSMRRIAQECGVTPMTAYSWFHGQRKPRGNKKKVIRDQIKNLIENKQPKKTLQDEVVALVKDLLNGVPSNKSRVAMIDNIAEACGVSRRQIYKWTSGEAKPYHPEEKIPILRFIAKNVE